jgi:hypothetical protein
MRSRAVQRPEWPPFPRPAVVNLSRDIHFFCQPQREKAMWIQISRQQSPEAPKVMKHRYLLLLSVIADIQIMMPIPSLGGGGNAAGVACKTHLLESWELGGRERQRQRWPQKTKASSTFCTIKLLLISRSHLRVLKTPHPSRGCNTCTKSNYTTYLNSGYNFKELLYQIFHSVFIMRKPSLRVAGIHTGPCPSYILPSFCFTESRRIEGLREGRDAFQKFCGEAGIRTGEWVAEWQAWLS